MSDHDIEMAEAEYSRRIEQGEAIAAAERAVLSAAVAWNAAHAAYIEYILAGNVTDDIERTLAVERDASDVALTASVDKLAEVRKQ